jgi:tRNA pseudouridine38-40 synthase
MRNLKVILRYDGTNYYGFQFQPLLPTIQGVVESAWSRVLGFPVRVFAAGRTDRGVHADGQVVNFWDSGALPLDDLQRRLLFALPPDICVASAEEVSPEFNARYSARLRTYVYRIQNGSSPSPFWSRFAAWWPQTLDPEAINEALSVFIGKHDFWAFCGGGVPRTESQRTVTETSVEIRDPGFVISVSGHSFLPRMVRLMVGAALMFARREIPLATLQALLTRPVSKFTHPAPPHGLCLESVLYGEVCPDELTENHLA